ncbi:histidine phosphotransferase family protein [Tabrizicola sp. BL-A-41-H6]|uniref:histidine phosphotransferase family protein n=1 Tax=Tabrizicola sp. BL-A-41-H6 TaxID=3421107 RepID=UPI003D677D9A
MPHDHSRLQQSIHFNPTFIGPIMQEKPDFAAMIGSRICHDLISPIGAIGNGVELMQMDNEGSSPELALIAESVANANARIRFFRVAYGVASSDQRIAKTEVISILTDITRGTRLIYAWNTPADLSRREVRLAFLMLQCLETAMAYGGRVQVDRDDNGWRMAAEAPRLKLDAALWDAIAQQEAPAELGAGHVHFGLVPGELDRQGRSLIVDIKETTIRLSF